MRWIVLLLLSVVILLAACEGGDESRPTPSWFPVLLEAERNATRRAIRERMEMEARTWGDAQAVPLRATEKEPAWTASVLQEGYFERVPMGCYPLDAYRWADPTIVGAGFGRVPCGTLLRITNPENGVVLYGHVSDVCVSCYPNRLKLSRAGMGWLCGLEWPDMCDKLSGLILEKLR